MLWLLRHGDAAEGSPDDERPLTDKGRRQAQAAGAALAALGVELDACLSSPKLRAVDSARLACEPLGVDVTLEPRLAGGDFDPGELAAGLGDEVMLVGHDPDFSNAISRLTGARVQMKKGGIAAIDGNELVLLLRSGELDAIAAGA